MAIGDFAGFREALLIAIARAEPMGSLIQPKAIADQTGLIHNRGWVGEAVRMLQASGFVNASFSIGDPDAGVVASITGAGWEEAERLADRQGTSLEEPASAHVEDDTSQPDTEPHLLDEKLGAVEPLPPQGAGPHFTINAAGRIALAPPSELDAASNNLSRITQFLPLVRRAADDLAAVLNPTSSRPLAKI
jgi:hypothetical protein